ncbi:winged helix-turn-helix domain-containing protein [Hymenobacter sp. 5317J-9]|uniref:winged helix-turn-helix domain-containing protein n=1 Tax=Hymenobacter sp. 5317J-9 TaxID=2932250 RepID=UPI001FD6A340|nr:winged helix-turn-helix domain-containing protein [Hymenobacter sp. 5317J-9]UOQ99506.1 winged helix-turn-helix domain-containing protein [Hymenobacter sp. 5317J-9]
MKVLIVEEEPEAVAHLRSGLEAYGMHAAVAPDAAAAQHLLATARYGAVILGVRPPEMAGFELCALLRREYEKLPLLLLTTMAATHHKLRGFAAGADDYLVQPVEVGELAARLRALHRRFGATPAERVLKVADLELHSHSKVVKRGEKRIDLTVRELALLEYFMSNQGRALTRAEIVGKVWDLAFDTGTNMVDVYVSYLRSKIDKHFSPKLIHTLNGVGYVLEHRAA